MKDSEIKQATLEAPEDIASIGEMVGGAAPEMGQDPTLAAGQGEAGAGFGGFSQ